MKKKIKIIIMALVVIAIMIAAIYFGISFFEQNKTYTDYEIMVSVDRNDSQNAEYCKFAEGFARKMRIYFPDYRKSSSFHKKCDGSPFEIPSSMRIRPSVYQIRTPPIEIRHRS